MSACKTLATITLAKSLKLLHAVDTPGMPRKLVHQLLMMQSISTKYTAPDNKIIQVIIKDKGRKHVTKGEDICVHQENLDNGNERDGVSNHRRLDCLYSPLFRRRSKKNQSSASLAFVRGIHGWPEKSPHKGPVTRKMYQYDDVIMQLVLRSSVGVSIASLSIYWHGSRKIRNANYCYSLTCWFSDVYLYRYCDS